MDLELVAKIVAALGAIGGLGKILYEVLIGKRGRMREEYKFAKEFLDAVERTPNMHPYIREKGYQAISGDHTLSADEVEYLLTLVKPDRALRDYVLGRPYLEHFPHAGNLQIAYKKRYRSNWSRRWRLYLYVTLYFCFALAAFAPFMLASLTTASGTEILWANIFSIAIFGPYAWWSIKAGARIYRAKMLVTHQHKHTQCIMLQSYLREVK